MNNSNTNSEQYESNESNNNGLEEKITSVLIEDKKAGSELMQRVKWSLNFQKQNWDAERVTDFITGNIRGFVAEEISYLTPLSEAENVFTSGAELSSDMSIVSPESIAGVNNTRKGDILSKMVEQSLIDKPLAVFDPNIRVANNPIVEQFKEQRQLDGAPQVSKYEYANQIREYIKTVEEIMNKEIVQGLGYSNIKERKDGSITPAGELYNLTVIPDGLIIDEENNPTGLIEVKAYEPGELAEGLTHIRESGKLATKYEGVASDFGKTYAGADKTPFTIGADFNREVAFVDTMRGLMGKGPEKGADNIIVLRFLNDMPNNLLNQYGEMLVDYGFNNVIIQKLPVGLEELDNIGKNLVKAQRVNLNYGLLGGMNFSDRELAVLEKYTNSSK